MNTNTLLKLMAAVLLVVTSAVFLAACSDSGDDDTGGANDAAEHVDDTIDTAGDADEHTDGDAVADDHDADADDHDADADDHDADADDHTDGDDHGDAVEVVVSMTDQLRFEPNEIVVEAGQPVRLTIENAGLALHDFTIDEIEVHVSSHEGDSDDSDHADSAEHGDHALHLALDGNSTGALEFTPEEAGEYQFLCTVEGHAANGMFGTLIVTEA